jgi:spore germination protein
MKPLAVAMMLLVLTGCSAARSDGEPGLEVLGFAESAGGAASVLANADALSYVGVDGVTLADGGTAVPLPDDAAVEALEAAHDAGLGAELLVSNYDGELGDFSPANAAALLGDAEARSGVATSLAEAVRQQGWDGVMIDLESMTADDADGLTAFARDLREALGSGPRLDIALMAATDAQGYRAWGYDLAGLADIVDGVSIMTYDQHGTWSEAGPVGALAWQREVATALLDEIPSDKIDLGVAGYGYAWGPDGSRSVSVAEARDLAGSAARFDETVGEWTAVLDDGTILWWSDSRSQTLRADLARELGLRGVAIWSLGQSDAIPDSLR